jgi:hypothetical protein
LALVPQVVAQAAGWCVAAAAGTVIAAADTVVAAAPTAASTWTILLIAALLEFVAQSKHPDRGAAAETEGTS